MRQDIFSVGQIAKVLHVARSTVVRWIANGHLKSSTTKGGDNRISRKDLREFCKSRGIPIELLDSALSKRILVYDKDEELKDLLEIAVKPRDGIVVKYAANPFDAGYLVNEFKPHLIIMDIDLRNSRQVDILEYTRAKPELDQVRFLGTSFTSLENGDEWLELGFDAFMRKPVKEVEFLATIEELLPTFRKFTTKEIR